jgi:hypothetical protein
MRNCCIDLEQHERIGIGNRQLAEGERIEQPEERGVGADADSQREHGDHCECRTPQQHPHGVPDVSRKVFEQPERPA